MKSSLSVGREKAVLWLTQFYGTRGCSENMVYKVFRKHIKDQNEAINAAREYIENECDVKTTTRKMFKKGAFLNNSYSNLLGE